jgi:CheY-like chemotaxis protein
MLMGFKSVLYVEDDKFNCRLMQKMLKPFGYEYHEAMTGLDGIAMATALKPAVIIMDYMLPDINGIEATRLIKKNPETTTIPIIMLTSDTTALIQEESLNAGCSAFLNKPISMHTILKTIMDLTGDST